MLEESNEKNIEVILGVARFTLEMFRSPPKNASHLNMEHHFHPTPRLTFLFFLLQCVTLENILIWGRPILLNNGWPKKSHSFKELRGTAAAVKAFTSHELNFRRYTSCEVGRKNLGKTYTIMHFHIFREIELRRR